MIEKEKRVRQQMNMNFADDETNSSLYITFTDVFTSFSRQNSLNSSSNILYFDRDI